MRKTIHSLLSLLLFLLAASVSSYGQLVRIEPAGARVDDEIRIIFDAKAGNKELVGASKVYMHSGVVTEGPESTAWSHVVGTWGTDNGVGELSPVAGAKDVWEITLTPSARAYYNVPEGTNVFRLAMVFRDAAGNKKATIAPGSYDWGMVSGNGDIFIDIATGPYVHISQPSENEIYLEEGESFLIQAEASEAVSSMSIFVKEAGVFEQKHSVSSGTAIEWAYTPAQSGVVDIKVVAVIDGQEVESIQSVQVILRSANTVVEELPAGVLKGINYHEEDPSKVTLVLEAPGKDFAYVVGDFTNWEVQEEYLMKQTPDGEFFWLEIDGLTPGQEYVFQYWVEGNTKVGDPYAEKVADPWNDQYIPEQVYPNLPAYNKTEYGVASVLQTGQEPYVWAASEESWTPPAKEELVIYELLLRDFLGSHSYQDLRDTLSYLKGLGVNAIELLPIMEFEGNNSWGYNPMYHFAPDKYYGTKNDLKQFIEVAHQEGMAVILDMVLNHAFGQSPLVKLYWDKEKNTVSPESPWFNPEPTHPFNVGFDFNHESPYTQSFVDSVNQYWLEEYHFDGYRFDLSKGFTQTNNPNNVAAWSDYDASRIAILKRMADQIWEQDPDAYIILEHFGGNREEKELAEYRAEEGKGMLLWGNLNHAYAQNTMGYEEGSDIDWIYHGTRNWAVPHVVGFMESHDEERLMFKNLQYGNSAGDYNVKDLGTALNRVKAASLLFYTVPGPKMLWQFGELGYDKSINQCEDADRIAEGCRVAPKPILWEYWNDPKRRSLYEHTADLIRLRNTYDVFTSGTAEFKEDGLLKQLTILNAANTSSPSSAEEMNVHIVANFDVVEQEMAVDFPHSGSWYDYYGGGKEVEVTNDPLVMQLGPGKYKLYTDYPIETPIVSSISKDKEIGLILFPNPAESIIMLHSRQGNIQHLKLRNLQGAVVTPLRISDSQWDVSTLPVGFYIAEVVVSGKLYNLKFIKK